MATAQDQTRAADRITGVDIARALAVFGMFTVHLGVGSIGLLDQDGAAELFHQLTRGRSSALFAFLAGLSLALISGRAAPYRGQDANRVAVRILVRASILVLLGGFVELLGTPIAIILVYYGLFFALALPFLRLRAPALAAVAAAIALIGPQLSYLIRWATPLGGEDAGGRIAELWPGPTELLLTGSYPAFSFMAFVVAGMAVGRIDLLSTANRIWLAATGAGLALLGYGGSWVALYPLGGINRIAEAAYRAHYGLAEDSPLWVPEFDAEMREWVEEQANSVHGEVPADDAAWLLVANPHTGTTFEILGNIGVGLLVLVLCLFLGDWLGRGLYPLAAVGSMPLTVYVGHLFFFAALGSSPWEDAPYELEFYVLGALIFATMWKLTAGKGLLERMIGGASVAVEQGVMPPRTSGYR